MDSPPKEANMERDEMIRILENIARDEDVNATARCTATRTLNELQPLLPKQDEALSDLYDVVPLRHGVRRKSAS
jgi:hypothetical protein